MHDPSKGAELDFTYEDTSAWQTRVVDGAALVKATLDGKPVAGDGRWLALDQNQARTSDLMAYIADPDPDGDVPGGGQVLATATDVTSQQSGDIIGMVDLSKPKGILVLEDEPLDAVAKSVHQIPFIATLDP